MNDEQIEQAVFECGNGLTETARQLVAPLHAACEWFRETGAKSAASGKNIPPQDEFMEFTSRVFPFQDMETIKYVSNLFQSFYETGYKSAANSQLITYLEVPYEL